MLTIWRSQPINYRESASQSHSDFKVSVLKPISDRTQASSSESAVSPILYGHGEFVLNSKLVESNQSGFNGQYFAKFRGCCWNSSAYNVENPEIDLRSVFIRFLTNFSFLCEINSY